MLLPLRADPAALLALPWTATRDEGVFLIPLAAAGEPGATSTRGLRAGGSLLIRMDPGCGYRPHRHVGTEDVLVLCGAYRDERGLHASGSHVHYAAGSSHAPIAEGRRGALPSREFPACVLFVVVPLGIELCG